MKTLFGDCDTLYRPLKALVLYEKGCKSIHQIKDEMFLRYLPSEIQQEVTSENITLSEVSIAHAEQLLVRFFCYLNVPYSFFVYSFTSKQFLISFLRNLKYTLSDACKIQFFLLVSINHLTLSTAGEDWRPLRK